MAEYPRVTKRFSNRVKSAGFKSKFKMFAITVAVVFLAISFFWGEFGFFRMWVLTKKIEKLENEIYILKLQRQDVLWEIDKMKNDPEYIQKYAVQKYGYARADQNVIQFVPTDSVRAARAR